MTKKELLALLAPFGVTCASDRKLSISDDVLRCPQLGMIAVGGDAPEGTQSNALLDALVWHAATGAAAPLRLRLGRHPRIDDVLDELAGLLAAFDGAPAIQIEVDETPVTPVPPSFTGYEPSWLPALHARTADDPPPLVRALAERVTAPAFRWYRPLSTPAWSGRVDGLQLCAIAPGDTHAVLTVGAPGKRGAESPARARFRKIVRSTLGVDAAEFRVDADHLDDAAALIAAVVLDRHDGELARCEPEHRLEARVLRGAVTVDVAGTRLEPVVMRHPFQFPALWSRRGERTRYIDVLMRAGDVPWVIELKVAAGKGTGQYYRHAIKQAVLYRQFVRGATELHPWFAARGLDARRCEAAVLVELAGRDADTRRDELAALAARFGVHVAVADDREGATPSAPRRSSARCVLCRRRKVATPHGVAVCGPCLAPLHADGQFREQIRSQGVDRRDARAWLVDAWNGWHPIVDGTVVGRAGDTRGLILTESTVSGVHAELYLDHDTWTVFDLDSTNGTEVNAQPIERAPVRHGDRITFGALSLCFVEGPGPQLPHLEVPGPTRVKKQTSASQFTLHPGGDPEGGGILRAGGVEVILPALELAFLALLQSRAGEHVAVSELASLPWNNATFTPNQLHQMVFRLRNRLAEAGLSDAIESARGVGYRVHSSAGAASAP